MKTKNPYCDTCRRAKFRLVRKTKGSFKRDAEFWGQHVTGDHVVAMTDLGKGIDGGQDVFIVTIFSGLRVAYPAPDETAESTTMALSTCAGKRVIHKLYADRSGETSKSLKTLGIMPQGSQPGVPQTNVVVERANCDALARTCPLLLVVDLPY